MTVGQIIEEKRRMIPRDFEVRKQYQEFLSGIPHIPARKVAMGKEIKEQIYFITSLQDSFKRHTKKPANEGSFGYESKTAWYHGIQYNQHDLRNAVRNLKIMLEIKANIGVQP